MRLFFAILALSLLGSSADAGRIFHRRQAPSQPQASCGQACGQPALNYPGFPVGSPPVAQWQPVRQFAVAVVHPVATVQGWTCSGGSCRPR